MLIHRYENYNDGLDDVAIESSVDPTFKEAIAIHDDDDDDDDGAEVNEPKVMKKPLTKKYCEYEQLSLT